MSYGQELRWGRTDQGHCARSLFHCLVSLWVKATCVPGGEIVLLQRLPGKLGHRAPGTACPGTGWGISDPRAPCLLATTGACQHRTGSPPETHAAPAAPAATTGPRARLCLHPLPGIPNPQYSLHGCILGTLEGSSSCLLDPCSLPTLPRASLHLLRMQRIHRQPLTPLWDLGFAA